MIGNEGGPKVRTFFGSAACLAALWLGGCSDEPAGVVKDEAMLAGVTADKLKGAASR
jgi:hypothetical protein